ncbi:hypothetical protein PI124_g14443 [Phytophthora idaei]|nr:hypothetical protein PI125_g11388 [Phytophthora idaei]KAG3240665.1 hypothetical protein PI124_g14443 [Phytophthora idaei]
MAPTRASSHAIVETICCMAVNRAAAFAAGAAESSSLPAAFLTGLCSPADEVAATAGAGSAPPHFHRPHRYSLLALERLLPTPPPLVVLASLTAESPRPSAVVLASSYPSPSPRRPPPSSSSPYLLYYKKSKSAPNSLYALP